MTTTPPPSPPTSPAHVAELHNIGEEGSDMTRDIHVALFQTTNRPASQSLPDVSEVLHEDIGTASEMAQPGGFRRGHVLAVYGVDNVDGDNAHPSAATGIATAPVTAPPAYAHSSFLDTFASVRAGRNAVKSSYSDFVRATLGFGMARDDLYGDDDEDGEEDDNDPDSLNTPLVRHRVARTAAAASARRDKHLPPSAYATFDETSDNDADQGASLRKTVFTVLKSFVGSGILFLPRAFANGGMLFSIVGLAVSAALSTLCMLRLTACSDAVRRQTNALSVSYGQLGARAFGRAGRVAVNVSLVLSQLGFCCSYLIFVATNVGDVLTQLAPADSVHPTSAASFTWTLLLLQIPLYTPLAWVRRLEYFALTNLVADVLILAGLVYIGAFSVETLAAAPSHSSTDWVAFNPSSWALFLGTAVYCFEGIGLVLPIYDAMAPATQPVFPKLLTATVAGLAVLFATFAGVVYAAFGTATQSVVTLNLPRNSVGTMAVQLSYSFALVLTYPLMLYPVVKILESVVFRGQRRRAKGYWRWQKNAFRFALVCFTAAVAIGGKNQLDNFVALIGGFCSVPLAFIYPCLFHSQLVNDGHVLNGAVILIGALTMIFASYQAIATWG